MNFILIALLLLWSIFCIIIGDWLLRKGVAFQHLGNSRGIWLQIIGAIITIGLPILVAFLMK